MRTLLAGLMAALCLVLVTPATIRLAAVARTGASPGSAPDLIVRSDVLRDHWLVRVEDLPAGLGPPVYRNCGAIGIPGFQGISAGRSDTYNLHLGGQYFVLDGGDGQPEIPPGTYILRITVNPPFIAQGGEPSPHQDPAGFCHQLPESDFFNNIGQVTIEIPDHPGRSGVGPEKGSPHLNFEPIEG